ncbi:hypothetical protein [Sediminibacillus massiliensis]|uniref:hypothetical protein n=1 Tax=Sediminibacillus massiliensis TaxID=1926277 RepID=UPI000988438C|nr:hypothetical protein [Sediminibacillus massiliensis]
MDTFLTNYWSLYVEFLQDFEKLNYKGFSLPYLCHLPSLLLNNAQINNELKGARFSRNLRKQVKDEREFQALFNKFVQVHQRPIVKNKKGKVVIHVDKLLRFPPRTIAHYFSPSNTILLTKGKQTKSSAAKGKKSGKLLSGKKKPAKSAKPANGRQKHAKSPSSKKKEHKGVKLKATRLESKKVLPLTKTVNLSAVKSVKTVPKKKTKKGKKSIPYYYLENYAVDSRKAISKMQTKAKAMFKAYDDHHFYKRSDFQKWFLNNIATVVHHIEMSRVFLSKVSVSCIIVSTTHSYRSRILAVVAAKMGIPTICMQHGIISSELGYIPKVATVDAVYGKFEKDWFKRMGAADKSLAIVGHPRFDQAFQQPKVDRAKFNKTLGLDSNKKTLMIAVRGDNDIAKWRTLIKTVSKKLPINIIIKNYPSKTPHALTKEFSFVKSTQDYSIYDIFPNVDAVVSYSSTVGLEAMLAQKTVFVLNENFSGYTGYYTNLGKLVQSDPRSLGEIINKVLTTSKWKSYADNKRAKFLRYAYPDLGMSGARLKNLVNKLIS